MASQKWGQKDSGQYSVYNPPTSNLDFMRTRGEKYETRPHPMGQRWGDKVREIMKIINKAIKLHL